MGWREKLGFGDGPPDQTVRTVEPVEGPVQVVHTHDTVVKVDEAQLRDAYNRGRRDERARRRGPPFAALLVVVALAGGALFYLAAREGSFSGGGQVVDKTISSAAHSTTNVVQGAANHAGDALENAGQTLKHTADPAPANAAKP